MSSFLFLLTHIAIVGYIIFYPIILCLDALLVYFHLPSIKRDIFQEAFFKGAGKSFKKAGKNINKAANSAKNAAEKAAKEAKNAAEKAAKEAAKAAKEAAEAAKAAAELLAKKLLEAGKNIDEIFKKLGKFPKKIDDILKKIADIPNQVVKFCEYIFVEKIGGIFTQISDMLLFVLVEPIIGLIMAFVSIFLGIFKILMLIIEKIISLPFCSMFYGASAFNDIFKSMAGDTVYNYIVKPLYYILLYPIFFILDAIGKFLGGKGVFYYVNGAGCFSFDVAPILNEIKDSFVKSGKLFGTQFGRFDKFKFKI